MAGLPKQGESSISAAGQTNQEFVRIFNNHQWTMPIPTWFLRATRLTGWRDIELYEDSLKLTYIVKIYTEGRRNVMYGKGWCLFVEKNCLMKDMVLEFLYYPSIRRSLIVQITRYCVPASFIEETVRKPIKVPAFFSRPRPTTLKEKTEFKVESVNEESSDNGPDNENTGEEDVVVSDQQGEHAAEDEFH
ncbi:hypothetical protein ZOSMA_115G00260 [Zostera marina]|uniref:TF-B3 domain-containing protein n=1 Tax=Zostera marina TaxID=29655 RepID=A0A0K9Q268_ZOSMR|nr:hypothetical protein ZOSMA_115G00260 [Zostera marina]